MDPQTIQALTELSEGIPSHSVPHTTMTLTSTSSGYVRRNACPNAALIGDIELLKWLKKNGYTLDTWTFAAAVEGGHLGVMKWLNSKACPKDEWAFVAAAERISPVVSRETDTAVLVYLKSINCPMDSRATTAAARVGNLDTLKWLVTNGCPLSNNAYDKARVTGHQEVVNWLLENNCYGSE